MDNLVGRLTVGQFYTLGTEPFAVLKQSEHLAEDLSGIAAVDLFYHEHKWAIRFTRRRLDRLHQDAIHEREATIARRPPSANEVLIGE